jgi:crotonobetainyl-CoA:carnitine CoA-transferase CaiB-like acyl-CoA transferase
MKKQELFAGLKILELSGVLAGPAVGMFFAELGATVIKVENPSNNGDVTRSWLLASESKENQSGYYSSVNYNKKVLWADLTVPKDFDEVLQEIAEADIVIANFKHASAIQLGLDAETLRSKFPKLIYAQISGYGATNDTPAFDVVLQAEAGFMYINGEKEGAAVKVPIAIIDILAAHHLKEAILIALLRRSVSNIGATVHVSLYNAALATLANQATNYLMGEIIPERIGSLHPNIAPYGETFYTKDTKAIVLAVGNDKQFSSLCSCLKSSDLVTDVRFKSNSSRVKNRESLSVYLANAFLQFESDYLLNELKNNKVPCGDIRNMSEVLKSESAQKLILTEVLSTGQITKRMATAIFDIEQ